MTALPALDRLDQAVIAAHAAGDGMALARLYREAAEAFEKAGDTGIACFFFTQAYVYALEQGSPDAEACAAVLRGYGRL